MGFKARKAREPDYQPTPREVALEQQNEATRQRLRAFIAEQEALMPPERPTDDEIAAELRAVILDGRKLAAVSSEASTLVSNLQRCLACAPETRNEWWQKRRNHYRKLAGKLAAHKAALVKFEADLWGIDIETAERRAPGWTSWRALDRAEREARIDLKRAEQEYPNGADHPRSRAFLALHKLGLRPAEIVDLALATDGVDWRTGERTMRPSAWLAEYRHDNNPDFPANEQEWHALLCEAVRKDIERRTNIETDLPYDLRWRRTR